MTGSEVASAMVLKWRNKPSWLGLLSYGATSRAPSTPSFSAVVVSATACCVEFEPVPASTRQRLFAVVTASRITCSRSSCESVGDSPVVPMATTPVMPAAICASINFLKAESSMPPSRNGVTTAVKVPRNISSHGFTPMKHRREESQVYESLNFRVHLWLTLNFNCPFKHKFGRTSERNISKLSACRAGALKPDLKFVATSRHRSDRAVRIFHGGDNQRACYNACTARQRFVFHAALIRARAYFCPAASLNEMRGRATGLQHEFRRKPRSGKNRRAHV